MISTRDGVHHLLYDEVLHLVRSIQDDFSEFITLQSIGKTHENRDIWMLDVDAGKVLAPIHRERKSILLVGAHHARELVSV